MKILALETSCDETAAAVVQDGRKILSSVVSTQIPIHRPFQGVVPELASRAHVLSVNAVIQEALRKAHLERKASSLSAIAVTVGPGLAGSLLVGRMTAEMFGWVHNVPVIGINHIEGHLLSPLLAEPTLKPPFLGLVASGGHTELIYAPQWGRYFLIGRTRDDAAGEAFDKVAKMMGLGYPGGPEIDHLAAQGIAERYPFPLPWLPGTWDFSFSGLKTAVLYRLREKKQLNLQEKKNLCAGFQEAVIQVLVGKTLAAARTFGVKKIIVGGGVAANTGLRKLFTKRTKGKYDLFITPRKFCTDNAAMIACSAYFKMRYGQHRWGEELRIQPQLHLPFYSKNLKAPGNFASIPLPF